MHACADTVTLPCPLHRSVLLAAWNELVQSQWPATRVVRADADDSLVYLLHALGVPVAKASDPSGAVRYTATAANGTQVQLPSTSVWGEEGRRRRMAPRLTWRTVRLAFGLDLVARVAARSGGYGYKEGVETTFEAFSDRKWKRWLHIWG